MSNSNDKKRYWKSLEEFIDSDKYNELAEKEFLNSPLSETEANDGANRRDFLKLMGASMALASASCVRRPVQKIVPYAKNPEGYIPGISNYYASSVVDGGVAYSVILKTREGRPIKMEGNPEFPMNKGALSARMQAHVVSVYDPDRLKEPHIRIAADKDYHERTWDIADWDRADKEISKLIGEGGVAVLTASQPSPSVRTLMNDFTSTFSAKHYEWDAISHDDVVKGQELSYGQKVFPRYRFENAEYIVAVGADFLGTYISPVEFSKAFAKNRKPGKDMSRMVVFEGLMSLTGMNADTRVRVKPSQYLNVLMGLAHEIVVKQGKSKYSDDGSAKSALNNYANVASDLGIEPALFSQIAKDLYEKRGKSLVIAGGLSAKTANAVSIQVAANFLNSILENDGVTIDTQNVSHKAARGSNEDFANLLSEMRAGKVKTLVIQGVNPAYSAASSDFVEALKQVKSVVYIGQYMNETANLAHFILPEHHNLENWGDGEFQEGLWAIQQPTIRPLYKTRAWQFNLMTWAYTLGKGSARLKDTESWYDFVRNNWKENASKLASGKSFDDFWVDLLQAGFVDLNKGKRNSTHGARAFKTAELSRLQKSSASSGFEISLYEKIAMGDGHYANVPWLQEMPDPVSKVSWDNYASVGYKAAKKLGIKDNDILSLQFGGKTFDVPAFVQVGQHDDVIGLAVGYGQDHSQIAKGIGFNAYQFSTWDKNGVVTAGLTAKVSKGSGTYRLANMQGHQNMEGRAIVVEATLKDYLKNPSANIHKHEALTLWPKHEYTGYRWGMSIDQNACTGCSACIIACQSENNIPVVGKKYVLEGREMHWMRIDRYFSGSEINGDIPDTPDSYFQPMICQQCENAPCETVCPVQATTHSEEGLNEMTYNRCVGTRYCSNNCPYKVRRFNWFAYTSGERTIDTPNKAYNPEVSVRSRGVMEKCTFCIQRIKEVKHDAVIAGRKIKDGEITTACEQSCPTDAIVFGDMNNPESRVSKLHKDARAYKVLEELNTVPSVRYLTKIRNTDHVSTGHGGHES